MLFNLPGGNVFGGRVGTGGLFSKEMKLIENLKHLFCYFLRQIIVKKKISLKARYIKPLRNNNTKWRPIIFDHAVQFFLKELIFSSFMSKK